MSLEHSPLCLLNLSTVPHFSRLLLFNLHTQPNTTTINRLRITYNFNVLPRLNHAQFASPRWRGTLRFSSSSNLIRTYLNHLIRFLNYRCMNSGLITQKHSILGILGTHVPVHLDMYRYTWTCTGTCCILLACTGTCCILVGCTGTPLYMYRYNFRNMPRFDIFATFATN